MMGLRLPRERTQLLPLTVMAVTGNILPFLLIAWAEERVTSSLASILNATTPFFTLLLAVSVLRTERLTLGKVVGIVVGFTGVAILIGADLTKDRKSTRLNSSHVKISYAVFCL